VVSRPPAIRKLAGLGTSGPEGFRNLLQSEPNNGPSASASIVPQFSSGLFLGMIWREERKSGLRIKSRGNLRGNPAPSARRLDRNGAGCR
jgi:hypothetical protein